MRTVTSSPAFRRASLPLQHRSGAAVPETMEPDNNNNTTIATTTTITKIKSPSSRKPKDAGDSSKTNNNNNNSNDDNNNNNHGNSSSQRRGRRGGQAVRVPGVPGVTGTSGRRASVTVRKPRASSFTEECTEMAASRRRDSLNAASPACPAPRRASVPQGGADRSFPPGLVRRGSRLNFPGAGRRVSLLLRYRQAFLNRRPKPALREEEEGEEGEENPMAPIHQLPHSPRFSTFLSPEAQFAMMKGYEDKLYQRISDANPEVRASLQRTRTPFQRKISIVDRDGRPGGEEEEEEEEEEEGEGGEEKSRPFITSGPVGTVPASTRSFSPESSISASTAVSMPYLKPLRRQSVDVNGNGAAPMCPLESSLEDLHLTRSHSLPTLDPPGGLSVSKRLVLTYRLESAMDLLDAMKERGTEHSLSPRLLLNPRHTGQGRRGDVARDFNSWIRVWNKEFKGIPGK